MFLYKHLCDCHNHTALQSLKWRTPLEALDGETPDISVFRFSFYEPVWYLKGRAQFPDCKWVKGRFIGIAWNMGDQICFDILPVEERARECVVQCSVVLPRHHNKTGPCQVIKQADYYYFPTPCKTKTGKSAPVPAQGKNSDK